MTQLEPVTQKPPYVALSDKIVALVAGCSPTTFDVWPKFQNIILTSNHRSSGPENKLWRDILENVSIATLNDRDITELNKRLIDTTSASTREEKLDIFVEKFLECERAGQSPICLLPLRIMCKEFNIAVMAKKNQKGIRIPCIDIYKLPTNRPKSKKPWKQLAMKEVAGFSTDDRQTGGLAETLVLAVGGRVMSIVNDKKTPGLVNGSCGNIIDFYYGRKDKKTVGYINVKFDNIPDTVQIKRIDRMFTPLKGCHVHRQQFPLACANAITIHKSQSLSLECVFADLGRSTFACGQAHVALSRCTSLAGLYLLNFSPFSVIASSQARVFQANLLNSNLGQGRMQSEPGSFKTEPERIWCTTSLEKKAKDSVKSSMSEHLAELARNASSKIGPKTKPVPRKKSTKPTANVNPPSTSSQPAFVFGVNSATTNSTRAGRVRRTRVQPSRSSATVHFVPDNRSDRPRLPTYFEYHPVDEAWQRNICNLFNFPFHQRSTWDRQGAYTVLASTHPIIKTISGDGNCFYRCISYIVTGQQQHYRLIKRAIMSFIHNNLQSLKDYAINLFTRSSIYYISQYNGIDTDIYPEQQVMDWFNEHSRARNRLELDPFADVNIIYMTSHLFKTKLCTYHVDISDWGKTSNFDGLQGDFLAYPFDIPETPSMQMYITHEASRPGAEHFNCACGGYSI